MSFDMNNDDNKGSMFVVINRYVMTSLVLMKSPRAFRHYLILHDNTKTPRNIRTLTSPRTCQVSISTSVAADISRAIVYALRQDADRRRRLPANHTTIRFIFAVENSSASKTYIHPSIHLSIHSQSIYMHKYFIYNSSIYICIPLSNVMWKKNSNP